MTFKGDSTNAHDERLHRRQSANYLGDRPIFHLAAVFACALLCMAFTLALPDTASAADYLRIDGVEYEGNSGIKRGEGWTWDGARQLVLDGYSGTRIQAAGDLTVTLKGSNRIEETRELNDIEDLSHGLLCTTPWNEEQGDLRICGAGSLEMRETGESKWEATLLAGDGGLEIDGTSIRIVLNSVFNRRFNASGFAAVRASQISLVNGANLDIEMVGDPVALVGMQAQDDYAEMRNNGVVIKDSALTIKSPGRTIESLEDVEISNSSVRIVATDIPELMPVYAVGQIIMDSVESNAQIRQSTYKIYRWNWPGHYAAAQEMLPIEGSEIVITPRGSAVSSRFEAQLSFRAEFSNKNKTQTTTVTWDDAWFMNSPFASYNHELAIVGSVLSSAAYREKLITGDLEELGFDKGSIEPHYSPDFGKGKDKVAYVFATRVLANGEKLVAVIVRGTHDDCEWDSNFNVDGRNKVGGGQHEGFETAALEVVRDLQRYCSSNNIDVRSARFLMSGHSRGAAVASIIAAMLNGNSGWCADVTGDNVYCYTFATPAMTTDKNASSGQFDNIYNIIGPEDFITTVPLKKWNYRRYGVDLTLPSRTTSGRDFSALHSRMNGIFFGYDGADHRAYAEGTQVVDHAVRLLYDAAPSVKRAYEWDWNEAPLLELMPIYLRSVWVGAAINVFAGDPGLLAAMVKVGAHLDEVKHAHTSETYISWLQSSSDGSDIFPARVFYRIKLATTKPAGGMPSGGSSSADGRGGAGGSSPVTESTPINARVVDAASGALLARVSGGEIERTESGAWLAASISDGVLEIDVPDGHQFKIIVEEGVGTLLDVSAEERMVEGDVLGGTYYKDINLAKGECTADTSTMTEEYYCRIEQEGGVVSPSGEHEGPIDEVNVSVVAAGPGDSWGSCSVPKGSFTTVHAMPEEGAQFDGWYEGSTLRSNELDYTLQVESACTLTARFLKSLEGAEISGLADQTYTGKAITPKPKVTLGGATLKEGTDYTLSYKDNVKAGTATITVTGKGNYTGTKTATFKIVEAAKTDISKATVSAVADQTYTGKAITPKPKVKLGSATLKEGTDYTLSYKNNTAVGTATITVTGKGNYTGTKTATFKIVAAPEPVVDAVPVYRLYNKKTSEHLYTLNKNEYDQLPKITKGDWVQEGIAWYAPKTSKTPVYRLYNKRSGDHHYTTSENERKTLIAKHGWTSEGVAFYSDDAKRLPLYRVYNSRLQRGQHHYTADANERKALTTKHGWVDENIGFYGVKR